MIGCGTDCLRRNGLGKSGSSRAHFAGVAASLYTNTGAGILLGGSNDSVEDAVLIDPDDIDSVEFDVCTIDDILGRGTNGAGDAKEEYEGLAILTSSQQLSSDGLPILVRLPEIFLGVTSTSASLYAELRLPSDFVLFRLSGRSADAKGILDGVSVYVRTSGTVFRSSRGGLDGFEGSSFPLSLSQ